MPHGSRICRRHATSRDRAAPGTYFFNRLLSGIVSKERGIGNRPCQRPGFLPSEAISMSVMVLFWASISNLKFSRKLMPRRGSALTA
jgi:hypothetical protein